MKLNTMRIWIIILLVLTCCFATEVFAQQQNVPEKRSPEVSKDTSIRSIMLNIGQIGQGGPEQKTPDAEKSNVRLSPAKCGEGEILHEGKCISQTGNDIQGDSSTDKGSDKAGDSASKKKSTNISGKVINRSNVRNSANVAIGKRSTANMGSIDMKNSRVSGKVANKSGIEHQAPPEDPTSEGTKMNVTINP